MVVTCGATPYLRRTLKGVASQTHAPTRVVIVDIWSEGRDLGTGEDLLAIVQDVGLDAVCKVRLVTAPGAATFGAAVRTGLEQNSAAQRRADKLHETRTGEIPIITSDTSPGWIWLLHDDSAPDPRCLERLLRVGESGPSIGVAGAKQRDWERPEHILEVGIRATASARRHNPVDEDEIDQGQYDGLEDVLAVGLAGAIVRRDVWAALGGPDPALGPFGDGLEFSRRARLAGFRVVVVPTAIIFHARATYAGLRTFGHGPSAHTTPDVARSYGARRRAQVYNWVVSAKGWQLPFLLAWLLVLTPGRALARFAQKDMVRARAELSAGAAVLSRPDLWIAARRRTREVQTMAVSTLRPLQTDPREILRTATERRRSAAQARKLAEAPSELELSERAALASRRRTGAVIAGLGGTVLALVLLPLFGAGPLTGGALLHGDIGGAALFSQVTSWWVPAGNGHAGPSDPILTLALLPMVFGASLSTVLTGAIFLAIPAAALCAYLGAGAFTRAVGPRLWAALAWAAAPTLVAAVMVGRVGPAVAHALLPLLASETARALGSARRDLIVSGMVGARRVGGRELQMPAATTEPATTGVPSLGAAARASLLAAAITAAVPALLAPLLVVFLVLLISRNRTTIWFLPLPALLIAGPFVTEAIAGGEWEAILATPGTPVPYAAVPAWMTALGLPEAVDGWPGTVTLAAGGALLLLAILAHLRGGPRARTVRVAWLIAVGGLALALAAPYVTVAFTGTGSVAAWPGAGLSLFTLGLVLAVLASADELPVILSHHSFGWRHLTSAALTAIGAAAAVALLVGSVSHARTPGVLLLDASREARTPAISAELAASPDRGRTLALAIAEDGSVTAELWRSAGPQFHHHSSLEEARGVADPLAGTALSRLDAADADLAELVAQLATGTASDVGTRLADHAVGVVLVTPPASGPSTDARELVLAELDATDGLARVTSNETGVVYRVSGVGTTLPSRAWLVAGENRQHLAAEPIAAHAEVPSGGAGRLLVLAERADPSWSATMEGQPLPASDDEWRQAFVVPAGHGEVAVTYSPPARSWWIAGQAAALLLVALLALPARRRKGDDS